MDGNRATFSWNPRAYPSIQDWIASKDIDDWLWDHSAPPATNADGTVAFEFFPRFPRW